MAFFVLDSLAALWVFFDARRRRVVPWGWVAATLLLGPFAWPFWFARRPLKEGEVREGGTGWNVLKGYALYWTVLIGLAAIFGLASVAAEADTLQTEAEQAGAALGAGLGLAFLAVLWFVPVTGALMLGLLVRKSSVVEEGPTGPLAKAAD